MVRRYHFLGAATITAIFELEFSSRALAGLEHQLGDVREERALAEVDFLKRDGGEKLCENLIDVRRGLEVG
jgi:hypothetical protein